MAFGLLGVAVAVLSLAVLTGQAGLQADLPLPAQLLVAAVAGLAAARAGRSWWPLAAVGAAAYVWLLLWPPLLAASYVAGTRLRRGRDVAAYVAGGVAAYLLAALVGGWRGGLHAVMSGLLGNGALLALAVFVLPLALGLWVRARREVREAAGERAAQMEREQVMRAERARAAERARIAREMHDVVAHRVSLIVLHAGALELRAADEETAGAAALIGEIGREALAELRGVLGVLREPGGTPTLRPPPTLDDLDALLDRSRALGVEVSRRDEGEPRAVGRAAGRTAYRVVQEALTNVHKHAGGAGADVLVRYLPDELRVEVRNQPPQAGRRETAPAEARPLDDGGGVVGARERAGLPGGGWGLVGLRERVELLGGTLRASRQDGGGFLVSARIPA
ncbi:histidine kinase [Nonomuraea pusilla]|uniref:sensor histidine kinase n=1 Tax=Nonomuraea pusilla TaxID=46177 RepID=UPI0033167C94